MERADTIAKVSSLIRLDETAEAACDRALRKPTDRETAAQLRRMRNEHALHARHMRGVLSSLGEPQQPRSADFESFTSSLLAAVSRATHPPEVLASTRKAEAAVLLQYADAAETPLPLQVRRLMRRHLERDEAHLDAIDALRAAQRTREQGR